ncbi:hypothetical protein K0O23_07115 [Pontibacter aydingkolensis]|uniref:Uncharacterized protein n=1 Tax=Pontibacter aydingkolensis TaxID=1911536 RepID=A0ABS7CSM3_9BACT|nr:hypothetical protein [Pontibacter aydingkolensis]MBW7466832.1 hypothetical protein [Pontibacter aydingkolensis]
MAFLLPFCSGRAKILSSFPFPKAARSAEGFLAGAGLLAVAFVLTFTEGFVADFFVFGAALATSSTVAVVFFFMVYSG